MHPFFSASEWNKQVIRTLSYSLTDAADPAEIFDIVPKIEEGNLESWNENWVKLADAAWDLGVMSQLKGHSCTARSAFLRACNYYRTAVSFYLCTPTDERVKRGFSRIEQSFNRASLLFELPSRPIRFTYRETELEGTIFYAAKNELPRPTLIVTYGYDSNSQESYLSYGNLAKEHGFNLVVFDGPGQAAHIGELPITASWEEVITPLIDQLAKDPAIHMEKIALLGQGFGGMLAARAAAKEMRISCLIAHPGHWDPLHGMDRFIPDLIEKLKSDQAMEINTAFATAMTSRSIHYKLSLKMRSHHAKTPFELMKLWTDWSLEPLVSHIECPTLVIDSEEDAINSEQAKLFYNALPGQKKILSAGNNKEGSEHGTNSVLMGEIFDWLQDQLNPLAAAQSLF